MPGEPVKLHNVYRFYDKQGDTTIFVENDDLYGEGNSPLRVWFGCGKLTATKVKSNINENNKKIGEDTCYQLPLGVIELPRTDFFSGGIVYTDPTAAKEHEPW